MTTHEDTFYWDPDKQERVLTTYTVHLWALTSCTGCVEVQAMSEQDAARLALDADHLGDIWWDFDGDIGEPEVFEIECEEPPEGAILVGGERTSNATLDDVFEPEEPISQSDPNAANECGPCK